MVITPNHTHQHGFGNTTGFQTRLRGDLQSLRCQSVSVPTHDLSLVSTFSRQGHKGGGRETLSSSQLIKHCPRSYLLIALCIYLIFCVLDPHSEDILRIAQMSAGAAGNYLMSSNQLSAALSHWIFTGQLLTVKPASLLTLEYQHAAETL